MIKIGIVDDDQNARTNLKEKINEYSCINHLELSLNEYTDALSYLEQGKLEYDILFLDIDMPGMSGMELAEEIRKTNHDVVLVFCTNHQQFAINGYSVGALGFLVKPVLGYAIGLTLDRAITAVKANKRKEEETETLKFVLKDGPLSRLVEVSDISFVEVRQHYLLYNITDSTTGEKVVIKNRGTMQEAVERLSPYGFLRSSSSFLVNVKSITAVSRMNIYIGEDTIPIGRAFKESFMDEFSRYLAKKGWEDPCQ